MTKVVAIHQPNYLPWIGFFSKIKHSDCFVILDNAQYIKNSVINRNKIRTRGGWCFVTIPVNRKHYGSRICDVKLPEDKGWQEKHWKTISQNYAKAGFSLYKDFFEDLYQKDWEYLPQINEAIIFYLLKCFDINVDIVKASELSLEPGLQKTDLLIALLDSVGAKVYLSGPTGKDYLDIDKFKQHNIKLDFFQFRHPVYKQRYPGFEPNMAAIDLLFNVGEGSKELL